MTATVWIYKDTRKQIGDANRLFVFAREAAYEWLKESDLEGVAFEYRVFGKEAAN